MNKVKFKTDQLYIIDRTGQSCRHKESYTSRSIDVLKNKLTFLFLFVIQTTALIIKIVAQWSISQRESPLVFKQDFYKILERDWLSAALHVSWLR